MRLLCNTITVGTSLLLITLILSLCTTSISAQRRQRIHKHAANLQRQKEQKQLLRGNENDHKPVYKRSTSRHRGVAKSKTSTSASATTLDLSCHKYDSSPNACLEAQCQHCTCILNFPNKPFKNMCMNDDQVRYVTKKCLKLTCTHPQIKEVDHGDNDDDDDDLDKIDDVYEDDDNRHWKEMLITPSKRARPKQ